MVNLVLFTAFLMQPTQLRRHRVQVILDVHFNRRKPAGKAVYQQRNEHAITQADLNRVEYRSILEEYAD